MHSIYSKEDILALDKQFRINLVNTASGIRSPHLIGSQDSSGNTNLAVFNSVIHIGANPAALGFIMRPLSVARHSYENIKEQGYFTMNLVASNQYKAAHQTSAKYPREESEFDRCGFTEEYIQNFPAPFVQESQIKIGLSLVEEIPIQFNDTILIVGKIETLIVPTDAIGPDGIINHAELDSLAVSGLYSYYRASQLDTLDYARPETKF